MSSAPLRIGARKSPLARAQVAIVARLLAEEGIESTFVGITTTGDTDRRALTQIGGTGVFVSAVRDALRRGEIDLAVHSYKDLPTAPADDLVLAAVPAREDSRDVLVGSTLAGLPDGARVGTGAPRRAVQLLDWAARHGRTLECVPIRGNVDTRIELVRSGSVDAVLLAAAGLRRLGRIDDSGPDTVVSSLQAEVLAENVILPAAAQGALALEISASLSKSAAAGIAGLDNRFARAECLVERAFLARLEAGCTAPVGVRAVVKSVHGMEFDLTLAAVIERTLLSNLSEPTNSLLTRPATGALRLAAEGPTADPEHFGRQQAEVALAELGNDAVRRT